MKTSDDIQEICKALVGFHSEVGLIEKDGENPHFHASYATIDNIMDVIRPVLAKHDLFVMQLPTTTEEGEIRLVTRLYHSSGQVMESPPIVLKPQKQDAQGIGSAVTYARRYSLTSFLGLATGDDDDGNAASNRNDKSGGQHRKPEKQPAQFNGEATDKQRKKLFADAKDKGLNRGELKQLIHYHTQGKTSTKDLTKKECSDLIKMIQQSTAEKLRVMIGQPTDSTDTSNPRDEELRELGLL